FSPKHHSMKSAVVVCIFCGLFWSNLVQGGFNLKNVICESFNTSYAHFSRCEMKLVRRGVAAFYLVCELHEVPLNNVEINLSLYKKSNGYHPFLFNQTLDFCYYMRNPRGYPLIYSLHKAFISVSNLNHTCPYDHDVRIDGFVYKKHDLMELPIPNGEYKIKLRIGTHKVWRAYLDIIVVKSS
ncbi:hypothetical protein KR009_009568, partial [Drosophila setifemur]